ncbi:MAG: hypothetical protein V1903_14190 [Bacteroidota bacterium]
MKNDKLFILLAMSILLSLTACEEEIYFQDQDDIGNITVPTVLSDSFTSIWATRQDNSVVITVQYMNLDVAYKVTDNPDYPDHYEVYLASEKNDNWEKIKTIDVSSESRAFFTMSFEIQGLANNEKYYIYLQEITKKNVTTNSNLAVFIPSAYKPEYRFILDDYHGHDLYSFGANLSNENIVYSTKYFEYQEGYSAPAIFLSKSGNEPLLIDTRCWFPDFSSDGKLITYSSYTGEVFDGNIMPEHIMIYNTECKESTRVTSGYSINKHPAWSPDNKLIAFSSSDESDNDMRIFLYDTKTSGSRILAAGSDEEEGVLRYSQEHPAWSADGKYVYYTHLYFTNENVNPGFYDIYRIRSNDGISEKVFRFKGVECAPAISPDNSKIAFLTDLSGKLQIWIYDFEKQEFSQLFDNDIYSFMECWSKIRWKDNNTILFTACSNEKPGFEDGLFSVSIE